jgi:hypothetical protein
MRVVVCRVVCIFSFFLLLSLFALRCVCAVSGMNPGLAIGVLQCAAS